MKTVIPFSTGWETTFTAARVGDGGKKVEGKSPSWLQAGICG
jgi:hypothetical protein